MFDAFLKTRTPVVQDAQSVMKPVAYALCTVLAWASFGLPAHASTSASASFPAIRTPHPLTLDPALRDPAWKTGKVPASGGFTDLTTRGPARYPTSVYLLYDDTNLYVGFEADQNGTPITDTQTTNEVGFGLDDFVGIGIDTSGAGTQTYFFETTPRGVRYQQAGENARYRPRWQAAATVRDGNWSAVMIIPLRDLRLGAGNVQTWRFNFIRSVAATNDHYSWAFDGLMQDGAVGNGWPSFQEQRFYPALTGLHIARGGSSVRPRPHLAIYGLGSAGSDRMQFAQSDGSFRAEQIRPIGLDVTYPLTGTISFVGTLAPDFSNVEIDQQTIAPQEFRRALQEYRPFFSQGAAFLTPNAVPWGAMLSAPNQIFYSPGVGPFDSGEKIEGTSGMQSFGLLHFRGYDQVNGNTFDDIAYGYKHALPDRSFLYWTDGVLAHHSVDGTDTTLEGGVAGRNLHTGMVWGVNRAIERGSLLPNGTASSTNGFLDVHKPYWEGLIGYNDMTPNYGPLDGFTATSDLRGFNAMFNTNGTTKAFKNYSVFIAADRFVDRSGAVHQADTGIQVTATFRNGFSLDGAGPIVGMLRGYDIPANADCSGAAVGFSYYTGYPCYRNGRTDAFNLMGIPVGYRDGTPTPTDASASWGVFGPYELHQYTFTHARPIGRVLSLGLEYDGTYERDRSTGVLESQWLRRVSLGINLGRDSNMTFSLRSINGIGGFSPQQGLNLAAAFHRRFSNGNELFVNFGTPAAPTTLNRTIVKYVFHVGGDDGT